MNLRQALACGAVVAVLALTGCSASGDGAATGPASTGQKAAADQQAPVSAEALCAHLKKELPRIKGVGSEVGAEAQLAMSIATLYDDHLDQLDGDVVDTQAEKTCPETRAELLKATGLKSLGDL